MPSRNPLGDFLDYVAGLERSLREERQKTTRLAAALSALYDEQNDAPLERRRKEWAAAMGLASEALHGTAKQEPKPRTCGECAKFDMPACPCYHAAVKDTEVAFDSCFQPRADAQKGANT